MKKTVCMIYRLAYIILGLWVFAECSGYSMPRFFGLLPTQAFWFGAILFGIMGTGFWFMLQNTTPKWYEPVSIGGVLFSLRMLLHRTDIFLSFSDPDWMLWILLPLLTFLDWVLFAQKGKTDVKQILIATGAVAVISILLQWLFIGNTINFVTVDGCLRFLSELAIPAAVLFLLDKLFSSRIKNMSNTVQLLLRAAFLLLEGYAFYQISDGNVREMLYQLKYAVPLLNAVCFLCVLLQIISMASGKGGSATTILRAKGFMLVGMLLCVVVYWVQTHALPKEVTSETALLVICPLIFVADWLLFEKKNVFQSKDPFLWMIPPAMYYVVFILVGKLALDMHLYPEMESINLVTIVGGGVMIFLGLGFIIYGIDRILKRR